MKSFRAVCLVINATIVIALCQYHMAINKWRDLSEKKIDRPKIYVQPGEQNFLTQNVKMISYWIP